MQSSRFLTPSWLSYRFRVALGIRRKIPLPVPLKSSIPRRSGQDHTTGKPVRVLAFTHNLSYEGAPVSLKELLIGLKIYEDISPEVVSFEEGPLRTEYEAAGIAVHVIPGCLRQLYSLSRLDEEVASIAEAIRARAADIVFVNTLLNFHVILAAEKAGIPSVWNPREGEPWAEYFRFLPDAVASRAVAAIGLPRAVIFVAESTRARWLDFEKLRTFKVIRNSLNISRFAGQIIAERAHIRETFGWSADEIVFVCVGTICERKGQIDVLKALSNGRHRLDSRVRIVFVGDEPDEYSKSVRKAAGQFDKDRKIRVDFRGSTLEIGDYYAGADAMILCSRSESYPRVVLEALVFGLPIISTRLSAVIEQVFDPNRALLYTPGDCEELFEIILTFSGSLELRKRLASSSRARFGELEGYDEMLAAYAREIRASCV